MSNSRLCHKGGAAHKNDHSKNNVAQTEKVDTQNQQKMHVYSYS